MRVTAMVLRHEHDETASNRTVAPLGCLFAGYCLPSISRQTLASTAIFQLKLIFSVITALINLGGREPDPHFKQELDDLLCIRCDRLSRHHQTQTNQCRITLFWLKI